MSAACSFVCPLENGVHARPAGAIEELARRFAAAVTITNERTGRTADARSLLAIVGLDIHHDDRCRVTATGVDEDEAVATFQRFLALEFPHTDAPLAAPAPGEPAELPRLLSTSGAAITRGTPAVPGVGLGRVVRLGGTAIRDGLAQDPADDAADEAARLDAALQRLVRRYEAQADALGPGDAADVILAHRSVARDPEFGRYLEQLVVAGRSAAAAIRDAERHFTGMLSAAGSQILRERALDVRDVCVQLLREIYGRDAVSSGARLETDSVCVADALTPGEFLALDRHLLRGLVLAQGSTTSHAVILARSFEVPTIVGIDVLEDPAMAAGSEVVVDGDLGVLVSGLTEQARRYYGMERRRLQARGTRIRRRARDAAVTEDGRRVEVAANISTTEEAATAFGAGADAIGVFRTEMLFVGRTQPPSEDEQFEEYRRAVLAGGGKPVVVRLLDVGGDKPVPYLKLPREQNPFLGYRAVRMYPTHEPIIRAQVRALVRASGIGNVRVLVPFVSSREEVAWVQRLVAEEQSRAVDLGTRFDPAMPLGVMIEVPSSAYLVDRLAPEVSFFSIGTNDLLQYFFAADRSNRVVAQRYDPLDPVFVQFLAMIVERVHAGGRTVAVCGEMAADPECLPVLVGIGVDELSLVPPRIADIKSDVRALQVATCRDLAQQVMACAGVEQARDLVRAFGRVRAAPLVAPDLVVTDSASRSRAEALKELSDLLYVSGRTDRPRDIERALWARETVQSTAFGFGFAIPHCASDALRSNSVAVLRLAEPVEWGSGAHGPVRAVVLVAVRNTNAGTEHLKVLAQLARRLVHDEFREQILQAREPGDVCTLVQTALQAGS